MDNNILILILAGGAFYYFNTQGGKQTMQNITNNVNKAREPTGVYMGDSPLQKTNLIDKDGKNIWMRNIGENINPNTGLPSKWVWTDIYGWKDILAPQRPPPNYSPRQPETWSKW